MATRYRLTDRRSVQELNPDMPKYGTAEWRAERARRIEAGTWNSQIH